jgi:CubicO group peptidase (beta-lactamase class C family)
MVYTQPQLAGGVAMNAAGYARFLRRLMRGELRLGALLLQADAVPADPDTFPGQALRSPAPPGSGWYYGLGHWIEGRPGTPQAVSSSAGAFGFYPWISADRAWYGIVARREFSMRAGVASAQCGAEIRNAWRTGVAR